MAQKRAELTPGVIAFRDAATGRDWSFGQLNEAADAVAEGLESMGLGEGDRLGILCFNRADFFVVLFACQKTGIILCPLNWREPAVQLGVMTEGLGLSAVLHDTDHAALAARVGPVTISLDGDVARWIDSGGRARRGQIPADRPWYLLFTSGTTGQARAVIQTARMAWANAVNIGQAVGLTAAARTVNFLPLFHTAGINLYTLPVFLNGAVSTILPRFDAAGLLRLLGTGGITHFFGVPAIYQAFSLDPGVDRVDWSGVSCACGGAPLPEPLIRFFADRGAHVLNGCGLTETGPTVFLMDAAQAAHKIGSVGQAQILTEVRLAGVPDGQPGQGEVLLRGPGVTPGYYGDARATEAAFDPDGWLRTGDIARRDQDGYFYIVDRIKDMFISGGENVYPAEVERVLHGHPAVLEAAVIGVPDARWGEVGAGFVILRPGAAGADPDSLRLWCRERLAGYKVPATLRVVEDFPRTASGKIRKPELRKVLSYA